MFGVFDELKETGNWDTESFSVRLVYTIYNHIFFMDLSSVLHIISWPRTIDGS
jgi:hypothetical protein